MSAVDFVLAQFDTAPAIQATLLAPGTTTPLNLTGASVRFEIRLANQSAAAFGGAATIVGDASLGVVSYQWQTTDVALPGNFEAEWIVTLPGAREMTVPNDRYLRIEIKPRLDPVASPPPPAPPGTTLAIDISLDGVSTGAQQLVALDTTTLANGSRAWTQAETANWYLDKAAAFTPLAGQIVAGLNGGQWLREGFAIPVTADPSTGGGLALPIGFRVHKADGTAAWDKIGTGATAWALVGAAGVDSVARAAAAVAEADAQTAIAGLALRPLITDLASTTHNKGASTIGVEDVGGYFPTKNTEAALQRMGAQLAAMPAGTSDMFYKARASALLGTNQMSSWYMDFIEGSANCSIILTSGGGLSIAVGDSADPVNAIGGICDMNTNASATGAAQVIPVISTNFTPMAGFNSPQIRFYRACRFRMVSPPDANTIAFMGSLGHGVGVFGAGSTSKYAVRVRANSQGGQQYILSDQTVDTNWVYLETLWDGTMNWLSVNGSTPKGIPGLGLFPIANATESYWTWLVGKVGGAVNHNAQWDWLLWTVCPQ